LLAGVPTPQVDLGFNSPADKAALRQQQAVPEEKRFTNAPLWLDNNEASAWAEGWNSCRDAMLAAAPKAKLCGMRICQDSGRCQKPHACEA